MSAVVDTRFTVGLRALAEVPRETVEVVSKGGVRRRVGETVCALGRTPRVVGQTILGARMPTTMLVGLEHVGFERPWLDVGAFFGALGLPVVHHQALYPYVRTGVVETYYSAPNMRRWFVVLDWTALLAINAFHRLTGRFPRKERPLTIQGVAHAR